MPEPPEPSGERLAIKLLKQEAVIALVCGVAVSLLCSCLGFKNYWTVLISLIVTGIVFVCLFTHDTKYLS